MSHLYMSREVCGVDTKKFFNDIGFTILGVSRGTGISRATLTTVPAHKASQNVAKKTLEYMEEENQKRFMKKVEEVWDQYRKSDQILEQYRKEYGVARKYPELQKIAWNTETGGKYNERTGTAETL